MTDDDLRELAYSAHEEAMAFGLSHDTFLHYFKTVRDRTAAAPTIREAESELQEMREHGSADDAFEAAVHLERVKHGSSVKESS